MENLIESIAACRERDIKGSSYNKILKLFDLMGYDAAQKITNDILKSERVPQNLYGHIYSRWNEIKQSRENQLFQKNNWSTQDGESATAKEWTFYVEIITEIMDWHKMGLVRKVEGGCCAMNMDEYIHAGVPETWSPILTHFLQSYASIYTKIMVDAKAREDFLERYLLTLKDSRQKRTSKK